MSTKCQLAKVNVDVPKTKQTKKHQQKHFCKCAEDMKDKKGLTAGGGIYIENSGSGCLPPVSVAL